MLSPCPVAWGAEASPPENCSLVAEEKVGTFTHTTEETARIVRDNLSKSALYGGAIKGTHIDIWFPSHKEAATWGTRKVKVKVAKGLIAM